MVPVAPAHRSRKKSIIAALTSDACSLLSPMAAAGENELAAKSRHVVCQIGDDPIHALEPQHQVRSPAR
jgi:hypothetical protein